VEREVVLRETQIAAEPPPSVEGANWTERLAEIVWTYIKDRGEASYFETFRRVFSQSSYAQAAAQMLGTAQESRAITVVSAGSTAQLAAAAPATGPDWTLAQAEYGTTVDRYPISEMRAWPDQLPAVDDGLATLVTSCDLLAGDPDDPAGVALGVHASLVSTRDAIPACGFAAAAHPDIPRYLFLLGRALDIGGRVDWAIPLYQAAGDRGYSQALTNLGHLYRFGVKVPADYRKSFGYYKRSALIGNPQARMGLAILYQNGWGVQQSIEESMLWARLAGSQGWTNAYDMLATHYVAGRGVAKDDAAAFKLFLFAAQMGQTNAMSNLGLAYLKGEGTPEDEEQGLFWLNKAYASGNRYAAYHLGRRILKDDPAAAEQYFVISAERDFQEARFELAKLYSAQKNFEEALFQLELAQRLGLKRDVSELKSSVSGNLDDAARTNVTARVDRWLEDNGY
jgi:TPR repeat protein